AHADDSPEYGHDRELPDHAIVEGFRLAGHRTRSTHGFPLIQTNKILVGWMPIHSFSSSPSMDLAAESLSSNWPAKIAHQNATPIATTKTSDIAISRNIASMAAYGLSTLSGRWPATGRAAADVAVCRRNSRQALAATASEDSSMVMAASQGCTQPMAASGIISTCHSMAPSRLWRAMRSLARTRPASSCSEVDGRAMRLACAAAMAVGTAMAM